MMQYRQMGKCGIHLSAVGFGTCQLRLVPEQQALETLKKGFELGVNYVHAAPDYEGAEEIALQAIRESQQEVMMLWQGHGSIEQFEWFFENACKRSGTNHLQTFGIVCIDDRELYGDNVWGKGGMVEFLLNKKNEGRLQSIFCTTHGNPEYLEKLIISQVFDAIMLAYNPLDFHLLSFNQISAKPRENLYRNKKEIFPLAALHKVGLIIMKPLAGGLLCEGKAFPSLHEFCERRQELTASDILRSILASPYVTSVLPGTANVEEAEENALSGYESMGVKSEDSAAVWQVADQLKTDFCSRCGQCDSLCSKKLPISWLFRDAYISNYPSETFETPEKYQYFRLHQSETAVCSTCEEVTCSCPHGIDIRTNLIVIHEQMCALQHAGLLPTSAGECAHHSTDGMFSARIISRKLLGNDPKHATQASSVHLENTGKNPWQVGNKKTPGVVLAITQSGEISLQTPLRHEVLPGNSTHFSFDFPFKKSVSYTFYLIPRVEKNLPENATKLFSAEAIFFNQNKRLQTYKKIMKNFNSLLPLFRKFKQLKTLVPAKKTSVGQYNFSCVSHNIPDNLPTGTTYLVEISLQNTGSETWKNPHPKGNRVDLVLYWDDGPPETYLLPPGDIPPSAEITVNFPLKVPPAVGRQQITVDLVKQNVTLFSDQGANPLIVMVDMYADQESIRSTLFEEAVQLAPWFYLPAQSVARSSNGLAYPRFVYRAKGALFWDQERRKYIDYIMGWGSALLGYAEPRVQDAVSKTLGTAALASLPYQIEFDVARLLVENIPCAEMVAFGKNGSDVCTLAVRLARISTGKKHILFSGYHGWQDWYVEQMGFESTGVPQREGLLTHRFDFNKTESFMSLVDQHKDDIAAVMLEPSGPVEAAGPAGDIDHEFLQNLSSECKRIGALLIYDEIITGFRYPGGGIQHVSGVVPDLACFGKALSNGMPLSALVGKEKIIKNNMGKVYYGPTFKGEMYSLAAAREALKIYRDEPVADHVWDYGTRLKREIDGLCKDLAINGKCLGTPFRFILSFASADSNVTKMMQTLYHQELLKQGLLTFNGFMLPSYAHNEELFEDTLKGVKQALVVIVQAVETEDFERYLEIPEPIPF